MRAHVMLGLVEVKMKVGEKWGKGERGAEGAADKYEKRSQLARAASRARGALCHVRSGGTATEWAVEREAGRGGTRLCPDCKCSLPRLRPPARLASRWQARRQWTVALIGPSV